LKSLQLNPPRWLTSEMKVLIHGILGKQRKEVIKGERDAADSQISNKSRKDE
jgi:hypothetical protein